MNDQFRSGCERFVVLDRDGTIVVDRGYLDDPAALEFLPSAEVGLRRMRELGCRLIVITNQSGVGRGMFTLPRLEQIHARFAEMMASAGCAVERIYFCPHAPNAGCDCRKPRPGLLLRAAAELGFNPGSAVVIGDKQSDIALGRQVGAVTVLIGSESNAGADFVVSDLLEAATVIEAL